MKQKSEKLEKDIENYKNENIGLWEQLKKQKFEYYNLDAERISLGIQLVSFKIC